MILNALYDLYGLKRQSDPDAMPEQFWCKKNVAWELTISREGKPLSLLPLLAADGKQAQSLIVPDVQRASNICAFFLCDDARYVLGLPENDKDQKSTKRHEKFQSFTKEVIGSLEDDGAEALIRFIDSDAWDAATDEVLSPLKDDVKSRIVFHLEGDQCRIDERDRIKEAWRGYSREQEAKAPEGMCLVTGNYGHLAKLFPMVTGLDGAQKSGTALISLNKKAFSSYGQKTNTAGAISGEAAGKAGNALLYVLKDSKHRVRIGDDYLVFWTESTSFAADDVLSLYFDADYISPDNKALDISEDVDVRDAVGAALESIRRGKRPLDIPADTPYHLLGLAPYQARLAVRLYETGTLGTLHESISLFLRDTEMVGVKPCSLKDYLLQAASSGKNGSLPGTVVTACLRAVIHRSAFPAALFEQILLRMRIDKATKNCRDMGRRAAILRACLIRKARRSSVEKGTTVERSLTVSLNKDNSNQGYLLGRLFALLERVQRDAIGDTNASIRDRYMGAAATTPGKVFPQLLSLAQHHVSTSNAKSTRNRGDYINRMISEVVDKIDDGGFPKTLSYDDQGVFYIGYYQQREALFAGKGAKESTNDTEGQE